MTYDGIIRIGTKIDTGGVAQGVSEIVKAVGQGASGSKPMQNTEQEIKRLGDAFSDTAKKVSELQAIPDTKKAEEDFSSLEETLESVSKSFSEISQNAKNIKIHRLEDFSSDYKVPEPKTAKISPDSIGYNADAIKHMEEYASKIDTLGKKEEARINAIQAKEEARRAKEISAIQSEMQEEERLASIRENAVVGNQKIVEAMERRKQLQAEIKDLEKAGVTRGYVDYDSRQKELARIDQQIKDYGKSTENAKENLKKCQILPEVRFQPYQNMRRNPPRKWPYLPHHH